MVLLTWPSNFVTVSEGFGNSDRKRCPDVDRTMGVHKRNPKILRQLCFQQEKKCGRVRPKTRHKSSRDPDIHSKYSKQYYMLKNLPRVAAQGRSVFTCLNKVLHEIDSSKLKNCVELCPTENRHSIS